MSCTLRVFAAIFLGVLSLPGGSRAQIKNNPPDVKQSRTPSKTGGTLVKKPPVITNDDISLLAARPPGKSAETPKAEADMDPAARESAGVPQDPEERKTEMLALEHQIKEKQRRIELLMRMFVLDEQAFLTDPSGQSEDEEVRAKRKFEQEELLQQGKDIARLRTRLDLLTAASSEKAAPVKP
jgi:hypothetical protein